LKVTGEARFVAPSEGDDSVAACGFEEHVDVVLFVNRKWEEAVDGQSPNLASTHHSMAEPGTSVVKVLSDVTAIGVEEPPSIETMSWYDVAPETRSQRKVTGSVTLVAPLAGSSSWAVAVEQLVPVLTEMARFAESSAGHVLSNNASTYHWVVPDGSDVTVSEVPVVVPMSDEAAVGDAEPANTR
jgi:hypothetical protein